MISIGSFTPDRHEVPAELATRADAVVVDDVSTALEDAGPIIAAVASGEGFADRPIPLGGVVAGLRTARRSGHRPRLLQQRRPRRPDAAAALAIVTAACAESR